MISVYFQDTPFNNTGIQIYALTSNAGQKVKKVNLDGSVKTYKTFYPQKRCTFHYRRLESKSRKSRNTWGKG